MTRKIFDATVITLGVMCFIIGFVIELFNFNIESCWFITAVLFSVILIFFPRSISRVNRHKNSILLNILIVLNSLLLFSCCLFLMANLIYFALFGVKLMQEYQAVVYPLILLICLLESYIDFILKEKFKKNPDNC